MRRERSSAREVGAHAVAAALLLAFAIAAPRASAAARLVDVRVGMHPGFARVVLETDAPAAHEVVSADAVEVVVRIEAASAARTLPARTDAAPSIVLEPTADGATLARIRASGPLRVETQVLAAPPRVVLDLRETTASEAVAPAPAEPAPVAVAAAPEPVAAEPPPPTPDPVEPPPPPAERTEAPPLEADLPPVAAPPPASIALEPRSLATGLAIGFALALFAFAARRPARDVPVEALPPPEPLPAPPEAVASAVPSAPERAPLDAEAVHDWVRMHQRLDARLADVATRLDGVAARLDHLEASGRAQTGELASHRIALARLRAALRPAARAPGREGTAPPAKPG